jgi:uncharacterized membrane protein
MTIILILYVIVGILLVLTALPLLLEKVPPNPWYGFRLPQTRNDPGIWYAVNKHSAKRLIAAGACTTVAAILLYRVPGFKIDTYALACLGVTVVTLVVGLVQSVRYMRQLARDRDAY